MTQWPSFGRERRELGRTAAIFFGVAFVVVAAGIGCLYFAVRGLFG